MIKLDKLTFYGFFFFRGRKRDEKEYTDKAENPCAVSSFTTIFSLFINYVHIRLLRLHPLLAGHLTIGPTDCVGRVLPFR